MKFDPTYGGELAELTAWLESIEAEKKDVEAAKIANEKKSAAPGLVKVKPTDTDETKHVSIEDIADLPHGTEPGSSTEGKA